MKTRVLLILFAVGMIIPIMSNQFVDARCAPNPDWPLAPCYDEQRSSIPTDKDKSTWAKYYDYKGAEFMESKKKDMLDALRSGKLCEWQSDGPPSQNYNVLTYYFVNKVISSNDCGSATEYRYAGQNTSEKNMEVNYVDFRDSNASVNLGCSDVGFSSKESCELQRAQFIGLIGIAIAALIGVPIVLFNRKKK